MKQGFVGWDFVIKLIIGLVILLVIIAIIVAARGEGFNIIEKITDIF